MRFSCKLTNTTITFIESEGLDATDFLMELPWSDSLLSDPGQTLPATEMESFFTQFLNWWETKKGPIYNPQQFLKSVGRSSWKSRSWGTLDSVLRMMPDVFEVWQRPSKLLGHFVDPEPVVTELEKHRKRILFLWPHAPIVHLNSFYVLLGCLEVLPKYMGSDFANCSFDQGHFYFDLAGFAEEDSADHPAVIKKRMTNHIYSAPKSHSIPDERTDLTQQQRPLSVEGAPTTEVALSNEEALFHSLSLSPEAFREMVAVVEKPLKPNRKAKAKIEPIGPEQLTLHSSFGEPELEQVLSPQDADLESLQQNLSRILDFFVRATQLVTLMAQQNPDKAKNWMKRLNWDRVQDEFPGLVEESVTLVKQLKSSE